MDIKTYIESGILELYVAGRLSENENQEIYNLLQQHPELLQEVLEIEAAVVKLTAAVSPHAVNFNSIKGKLGASETKVVDLKPKQTNWISYTGWAASILLAAGLLWTLNQNTDLEQQLQTVETDNIYLETQIEDAKTDLAATKNLLNVIRDKDIIAVPLGGQGDYASSFAKVYWNKADNTIYLDAEGLPNAPDGKVWQVWSLTLNPLTPTSLGTIDDFNTDENKIFTIANANESQAFGVTLEPEGGSATPTMEQLYTLGVVSATP
ncbi:anti-sigma factor [Winogradskyella bathintestinalis]|uniref:Anti-sigma factor n=1 Tax=Winogradskyella bathintestinalis TaxID=3035208 RepID=A0ABT7ZTY5_9FLAO|nr:anti-sigma factor [Winogradskyella bathintestinalis]MDN3492279.1 anti-sigma factor [Winogradskyella bathintestinalis]